MAGLVHHSDTQLKLGPSRIKRDNEDLQRITSSIVLSVNPFTITGDAPLVNISTEKSVPVAVKNSLLSVPQEGRKMHEKFVRECLDDPTRFERPITRNKLLTFAKQCVTNRRAPQNSKEAKLE